MNKVILLGRLTKDPELRYTPGGDAVCDFSVAHNYVHTNDDGDKRETTTFVDCNCWGRLAENTAQFTEKGRRVLVEGRLKLDKWETEDGQKRSKLRVTATRVKFLDAANVEGEEETEDAIPSPKTKTKAKSKGVVRGKRGRK